MGSGRLVSLYIGLLDSKLVVANLVELCAGLARLNDRTGIILTALWASTSAEMGAAEICHLIGTRLDRLACDRHRWII